MALSIPKKQADSVLDVTKRLYERGLNSTLSGNVSARIDADTMVITPSALDKVRIGEDSLSLMRISDETAIDSERPKPSSEYHVHTRLYKAFPEINAVVHPHPPYSLSIISAKGRAVIADLEINEEEYGYYIGKVGIVKGKAGTIELADAVVAEAKNGATVIVMEDHGTVGIGNTMQIALGRVEAFEHMALKYYVTETLRKS